MIAIEPKNVNIWDAMESAPRLTTAVQTLGMRRVAELLDLPGRDAMKWHELREVFFGFEAFDHEHRGWYELIPDDLGEPVRVLMHTCPNNGLDCLRETLGGLVRKPRVSIWPTVESVMNYHFEAYQRLHKRRMERMERDDDNAFAVDPEAGEELPLGEAETRLLAYIENDYYLEEGIFRTASDATIAHLENQNDTMKANPTYVGHILWKVPGTDLKVPVEKPRWFKGKADLAREWRIGLINESDFDPVSGKPLPTFWEKRAAADAFAKEAWNAICKRMGDLAIKAEAKWNAAQERVVEEAIHRRLEEGDLIGAILMDG